MAFLRSSSQIDRAAKERNRAAVGCFDQARSRCDNPDPHPCLPILEDLFYRAHVAFAPEHAIEPHFRPRCIDAFPHIAEPLATTEPRMRWRWLRLDEKARDVTMAQPAARQTDHPACRVREEAVIRR